jgi:hypothetical protein
LFFEDFFIKYLHYNPKEIFSLVSKQIFLSDFLH